MTADDLDESGSGRSSGPSAAIGGSPLLVVDGVSKSYGLTRALDEVSLEIVSGEVHALLGHNGAGKSTLIGVLAGISRPDGGSIKFGSVPVQIRSAGDAQALGIAHVAQELSLVGSLSIEDNLLLGDRRVGLRRRESAANRRADAALLESLGVRAPLTTKVRELSIGERQLTEIARGLRRGARLLILDEPTATLSQIESERVFAAIKDFVSTGGSVLFVSHRLGEVIDICDRASIMRDGRLISTESIADHDRASLVGLLTKGSRPLRGRIEARADSEREPVALVRGLSVPGKLQSTDLDVRPGVIVGLVGHIGSGASTVLRAMAGLEMNATGVVDVEAKRLKLASPRRSASRGIWYTSSDRKRDGLFLGQPVRENLLVKRLGAISRLGVINRAASRRIVATLCEELGVDVARASRSVSDLSGGNQQKILIGRYLRLPGTGVLCLDEPTRGVDVLGRDDIHKLIRDAADAGNGVVMASTDLDEVMEVADVVVTFFAGRMIRVVGRMDATHGLMLADISHG